MVSTVIDEEIGHFFRGLSKLTLELSPSNSSSLRSCNDHFALGWVERQHIMLCSLLCRFQSCNDHFALGWVESRQSNRLGHEQKLQRPFRSRLG